MVSDDRFVFRVSERNPRHVHFTVFANGANCGNLVMTKDEFMNFCVYLEEGQADLTVEEQYSFLSPSPIASDSRPEVQRVDGRTRPGEWSECLAGLDTTKTGSQSGCSKRSRPA